VTERGSNKSYILKEIFTTFEKAKEYVLSEKIWRHALTKIKKLGKSKIKT
jgi:hypothetical protein